MNGLTFDLQRFATTWLLTLNSEGVPTLTDESDATKSTALSDKGSNGRHYYYYFSEVISDGDTVKLGEDITVADTAFYVGQTMTLDLNGKTLEVTGSYVDRIIQFEIATTAKGDLTITDTSDAGNGTLLKNDVTSTNVSYVVGSRKTGDKITLERGNLINISTKGAGIYLGHANTFTMTGGTIKVPSTDANVAGVLATNVSKITVNISGGTIETGNVGVKSMITSAASTVTISGGSISGTASPVTASNASKVTITGGVFNQADETLGISTAVTIDGETKYCVSVDTIGDEYIPVTIDGTTSYYSTQEKADAAKSSAVPVTIDGETKYFTTDETLAAAVKDLTAVTIDNETQYFSTQELADSAVKDLNSAEVDGVTKYYTDAQDAQAALDAATVTASVDGETKYFTTEDKMQAAVKDLTAVTIDGKTKYFTSEDTLAAAVEKYNYIPVTIDGTTKYFTTDELAAAATSDCIARIGDDKYYTTLQAAVNAVQDKGTITLLKDATGSGVKVASSKNFTLDFNKHTYTVVDTPVGSTGTETIGFQLLQNSTITFKDGKIAAGAYGANNNLLRLIQNYANLTLDNMNIDGSGLLVNSEGRKLVAGVDNTIITVSTNNGTLNLTGTTSIEAIDTRYYKQNGKIVATTSGTALAVGYAAQSYPNGAQVNVNTTGAIDGISFGTWGESGNTFTSGLTVTNGTIKGDITIDEDALTLGALDKITINGGTFANSAIKAGATLLVVDNVLVAKGWNSASDGYFYVEAPESGNVGTKLITVGNVTSTDQIKFDSEKQIFAVPTTATATVNAEGYKTVKVAYDANSTTATVTTTDDGIEITEKLLAGTVTKISASGNANTVYISGGDKVNSIVGGSKDDTLAGKNANITLTGGEGADIFVAGEKITITDYGVGSDKISVGADAGIPDIKVSGKNLVLTFDGGKTVNLLNAADKVVTVTNEDGDSYYSKDGQTSDDGLTVTLPASTKTYTVKAPIKDVDGSKTAGVNITGNALDNSLTGGTGNDKLFGNAGNDTLKASAGTDTLTGGKGDDVFVQGAGNAVITDYSASGSNGADKISLDATPTSFKFSGSNLVLTFGDERTLTVNGAKNKALTFAGDENDTVRTYIDNGALKENGKITLDQNFKGAGQNISKLTDVKQIDASTATRNLNLVGNNLGNTLKGGSGNDTLTGGTTAADELTGGDGSDTFVYNGGEDTITDYEEQDTLKLAKNFSIKSAAFGKDDVVFTLNAAGNVVTLTGAAKDTITVKDASNKVWTYTDEYTAQSNGVTLQASANEFNASADAWKNLVTLDGSAASAVELKGNAKNNVFVGTKGADTFVYSAGSDVITNYDATDKVQVDNFSSITAAKFGTKTVLTVGRGAITFNNAPKEINLVDSKNNSATLTNAGIVTEGGIQLFNGTKTYAGTADNVDASNVKNAVTLAGGSKAQTFTGAAGRTVYTFDGAGTMTIENYAAGDKISVNSSVTSFAVNDDSGDVTLTIDGGGSIVIKGAANEVINLHDNADKSGKYTARAYLQAGVTADKAVPTAVTLAADVGTYAASSTVKQITYTGGNVTITKFDTTKGKINHGTLAITDVSETALAFGTGNTLTIGDLESDTKVQLTGTVNNKTVSSTVYLGDHKLYNNVSANATAVSVTGGDTFTAGDKVNSVTALGSENLSIAGNTRNNTLTANDAGNTLDGKAGTDVLIGGTGNDIFIHDKITGTTTINNYSTGDTISLGDELSIVGSAYSPSTKNGTLTLTVEGINDAGKASTSKIVIKSDDFTKADAATYGTIILDGTSTSYGKNAIYFSDDEVKLLSTYSGKFTVTAGGQVDGSEVTKSLTLQGTTGNETLTGGAYKTTLTGGKGDDSLHGGKGADVFTYAKGDGKDVIADFTYNDDKLKVSTGKLISDISVEQGDLKFTMTDGGSVTIEDLEGDFVIKANSKLYWFDGGDLVTAKTNTADMTKIINDKTGNYAVVNLDYSTNLVTAELATASDQSAAFNAETYKKTTT